MEFLMSAGKFLLSIWLWNVTFGIGHCVIGAILLFVAFYFSRHVKLTRALFLSISSYAFAFTIITLAAFFVGHHAYESYYPITTIKRELITIDIFFESFILGIIYTILQTFYLALVHTRGWRSMMLMFLFLATINSLASYVSYLGIRIIMWYTL